MGDRAHHQRGGALGLVLVVLLALELLAHGGLLLARQERAASAAGIKVLQARMAAEGGLARATRQALPDSLLTAPELHPISVGTATVGPHAARSTIRRLNREVWLLEGEGQVSGESWTWHTAQLTWVMDPAARAAAPPSAVRSRRGTSVYPAGTVLEPPFIVDEVPVWCAPWAVAIDSLGSPRPSSFLASRLPVEDWPNLGRLGPDLLRGRLPRGPGSVGTPTPLSHRKACIDDPWNWGDPSAPTAACADRFAVLLFSGDLELDGGVGHGMVVVTGDLRMSGTAFEGLLIIGGSAVLSGGATVRGRLEVGDRLTLSPDSRVTASPCHVARGVHQARFWLARPHAVPEVGRMEAW